jgi:hypothetical protein
MRRPRRSPWLDFRRWHLQGNGRIAAGSRVDILNRDRDAGRIETNLANQNDAGFDLPVIAAPVVDDL